MSRNMPRRQRGATLVEALVTTCIGGAVLLNTLPGLEDASARRSLEGMAGQLESELHFARSLAVSQGDTVRVGFAESASGSCYVMYTGLPRQCTCTADGIAHCEAGARSTRVQAFRASGPMQVRSRSGDVGFDPVHGTLTPTMTVEIAHRRGDRVHLVASLMGRFRTCSPDRAWPSLPRCT